MAAVELSENAMRLLSTFAVTRYAELGDCVSFSPDVHRAVEEIFFQLQFTLGTAVHFDWFSGDTFYREEFCDFGASPPVVLGEPVESIEMTVHEVVRGFFNCGDITYQMFVVRRYQPVREAGRWQEYVLSSLLERR